MSKKFKELKSLAINYKDEKELEIEKLKSELNEFKMMADKNKSSYEEVLDKTTESIQKFIENIDKESEKKIQ